MKLSTKSTYGLRAILDIALKGEGRTTSIMEISKAEGISQTYLEQLLNKLRRNGLVRSVRGPKGGYILARQPEDITVADVVTILESSLSPIHCVAAKRDLTRNCKKGTSCVPKIVWVKLAEAIKDCLESVTLKDLCLETHKAENLNRRRKA